MNTEVMPVEAIDTNGQGAMVEVAMTRATQEVQAAMTIAKRFPRDETQAFARVMRACKRKGLAKEAMYAYPRGAQTITGPSIRLAEVLAQCWGNIDFGIVELEQRLHESTVMSYAWDLETNCRQVRIFTVPHKRHTKKGAYMLSDPRDIYELVANTGARRLRACILGVIPGDVQDSAIAECERTLSGGGTEPLIDRVRAMVIAFEPLGVTVEMIEGRLKHRLDTTIEAELSQLRKVFKTLADGAGKREDFFDLGPAEPEVKSRTDATAAKLAERARTVAASDPEPSTAPAPEPVETLDDQQYQDLVAAIRMYQIDGRELVAFFGVPALNRLPSAQFAAALTWVRAAGVLAPAETKPEPTAAKALGRRRAADI